MAKKGQRNWERQEFAHVFGAPKWKDDHYCRTFGHHPQYPGRGKSPCRDCDADLILDAHGQYAVSRLAETTACEVTI